MISKTLVHHVLGAHPELYKSDLARIMGVKPSTITRWARCSAEPHMTAKILMSLLVDGHITLEQVQAAHEEVQS